MHEEGLSIQRLLVVLATFCSQFIICGITYSVGIYHVIMRDVFHTNHFDISWVTSWLLFSMSLTSICARSLIGYLGCRLCVMIGGVVAAVGLSVSSVVNEPYQLYIFLGLVTGIGFGLACIPSIVAVEISFRHGRYHATSVALGGIGAGVITIPLVIYHLEKYYAWRGMFLWLGGAALQLCVCGALLRPIPAKKPAMMPMFSTVALQDPLFHAMCWSNLLWSFGSTIIYLYTPSYAVAQGTLFGNSMFLITCIGISAFMSRLIYAFMGNTSTFDFLMQILCSFALGAVITGVSPDLFHEFSGQIGYALLFGFYSGYWTSYMSQVCREAIAPEHVAIGNGYLSGMIALGALAAGPIAAWLLHEDESRYRFIFYMAGICLLASSSIMTFFRMAKFRPINIKATSTSQTSQTTNKPTLIDDCQHDIITLTPSSYSKQHGL